MDKGIAVVGLGCTYPGSVSPLMLWENILSKRQQFRQMPDCRLPLSDYFDSDPATPDKFYGKKVAVLDGYEFDWIKRRINKQAYESTDLVHWLALDVALSTIEDAGYTKETLPSDTTGVIFGNTLTGEISRTNNLRLRWPYVDKVLRASAQKIGLGADQLSDLLGTMESYYKSVFPPITEDTLAGGLANTIAGRICNYLDLHGGGYTVDGACSSSLLAVITAANALNEGQMDFVLAGGVDISLDTFELIGFSKTGALTPDQMNVYDKKGNGFIPGEGCGCVALKRLEDAKRDGDTIYAVLNGWGISSDGKGGITAPSDNGQSMALNRAYKVAGYSPQCLDFIEGHGTGTTVGDKTELKAAALTLNADSEAPHKSVAMTSLKSILGHTKAAAGIGAFIKTVMAVNQHIIPPTSGCVEPNPVFEDEAKALYPAIYGTQLPKQNVCYAGVSAMGFGGINSHVTLSSYGPPLASLQTDISAQALMASSQTCEIFPVSSDTQAGLIDELHDLMNLSSGISKAELVDLAKYQASKTRHKDGFKAAILAHASEHLLEQIPALISEFLNDPIEPGTMCSNEINKYWVSCSVSKPKLLFLFPGQGSQALMMAYALVMRFDWARTLLFEFDKQSGFDQSLADYIFKPSHLAADQEMQASWAGALSETAISQPARDR